MRRHGATDRNQPSIVKALRKSGCTVQVLSAVGAGCPDLMVARNGVVVLVEVKDGARAPSDRKLTPDQVKWHRSWNGRVYVANDEHEALAAVDLEVRRFSGER